MTLIDRVRDKLTRDIKARPVAFDTKAVRVAEANATSSIVGEMDPSNVARLPDRVPRSGELDSILAELRRSLARLQSLDKWSIAKPTATGSGTQRRGRPENEDPEYGQAYSIFSERFSSGECLGRVQVPAPTASFARQLHHAIDTSKAGRIAGPIPPEDLLFVDIETTGLSRSAGTLAFLIGVGRYTNRSTFSVDQVLIREPDREADALQHLAAYFERARLLVSFNGRCFDLPVLRNRCLLARTNIRLDLPHIDLLPLSRRLFRSRVENCRLGTLEREILGYFRQDDVDGSLAPLLYADFLQHGTLDTLTGIIKHNRLDVLLMLPLLATVVDHIGDPLLWAEDAEELLASGLIHRQRGNQQLAEACFERGLQLARYRPTRQRLLHAMAGQQRRRKRRHAAGETWELYRQEFPHENDGWVELAKYHEHITKDYRQALRLAEAAPNPEQDDLGRRIRRLRRKLDKARSDTASD